MNQLLHRRQSRRSLSLRLLLLLQLVLVVGLPMQLKAAALAKGTVITASDSAIHTNGRAAGYGTETLSFEYSGARMALRFNGTAVAVLVDDPSRENFVVPWLDGKPLKKFRLDASDGRYLLAEGLPPGSHTVEVIRATECNFGPIRFHGFVLNDGGQALPWPPTRQPRIEFVGDSITCGYGVEVDDPKLHFAPDTENFCLGYTGLTVRALQADYVVVARSGIGMVRDYDGPFEGSDVTIPSIYSQVFYTRSKPLWDFNRFTPDVVCVNLGTNDFSTSGVNVKKFVATYVEFGRGVLRRYPGAHLVVLQGPMNNTAQLGSALHDVVSQLTAGAAGRVHFLELSAQGRVGMGADSHPNQAQSQINARELTAYLRKVMGW